MSEQNIHYILNPLRGTITANKTGTIQKLRFPRNNKIVLAFLVIDRAEYYGKIECILDDMPKKLAAIFTDVKGNKPYFYHSNYSISIAECINEIVEDKNSGLVRSTRIEGKTLELLSMQIKQYEDDLKEPGKQVMLRKQDIEKIKNARKILMDNFKNPPTIEELAKKSGINQQKLKKGFKLIYNKTINSYSRDKRLEIAATKLLNGLSVREAADEVGYINKSHFASRFREKYGVLPKDYLKNIQSRVHSN
jgi:AraC-like DNA-binding protein